MTTTSLMISMIMRVTHACQSVLWWKLNTIEAMVPALCLSLLISSLSVGYKPSLIKQRLGHLVAPVCSVNSMQLKPCCQINCITHALASISACRWWDIKNMQELNTLRVGLLETWLCFGSLCLILNLSHWWSVFSIDILCLVICEDLFRSSNEASSFSLAGNNHFDIKREVTLQAQHSSVFCGGIAPQWFIESINSWLW